MRAGDRSTEQGSEVTAPISRAAGVYWLGEMATRGIQLVMLPLLGTILSPADYGLFAATSALLAAGVTLLACGLDGAAGRFIPPAHPADRPAVAESALTGTLVLASVLAVPAALVIPLIPGYAALGSVPLRSATWAALATGALGMVAMATLRSERRAAMYAVVAVSRVGVLGIVFVLMWLLNWIGIGLALWPMLVSWVAFGMLAWMVIRPFPVPRIRARLLLKMLAYGLPLLPHITAHWILGTSDRILLQALAPGNQVGQYSFVYQLCTVVSLVAMAMNNAWSPRFMALRDRGDAARLNRSYTMKATAVVALSAVLVAGLVPGALRLLSSPGYWVGGSLSGVLCAAFLMQALYIAAVNPLLWDGRTVTVSAITISCAIVNLMLNFALIPLWGMWAPTVVTLVTYALLAVGVWIMLGSRRTKCLDVLRLTAVVGVAMVALASLQPLTPLPRALAALGWFVLLLWGGRRLGWLRGLGLRSMLFPKRERLAG